jgi:peptidoglycan/LPS O-acetylase OafA/YrhL
MLRGLGIAWTLVIEVSFYLALPFLAWAIRSVRPRGTLRDKLVVQLGGLAVLYLLAVAVRVWSLWFLDVPQYTRGDWFPLSQLAFWLIGYLDWFALGMALAVASTWAAKGGRLPRVLVALGNYPAVSWFLGLELFWVAYQLNIPAAHSALLTEWQYLGIAFLYGLVALFRRCSGRRTGATSARSCAAASWCSSGSSPTASTCGTSST